MNLNLLPLMSVAVCVFVLIPGDVARCIHQVFATSNAFALARGIEPFFVRSSVLAGVRETFHGRCGFASL